MTERIGDSFNPTTADRAPARWYRRPHLAFVAVATVFGVLLVLIVLPGGGYDEQAHFLRAWHLSNGHVFSQQVERDGKLELGGQMPRDLVPQIGHLLQPGLLDRRAARGTWSHLGDPAPGGGETFVDFRFAAAVYPPVPYVPAAIAIRVGRLFGASTFALILLARLADLAAFIAIAALAIRRLPSRAWVLAVLALTPVALFQAASVSADGITTALMFLVVADAIALIAAPVDAVPRGLLIECALATLGLALAKEPYLLAAALLLLPLWRHRRTLTKSLGSAMAVSGVLALAWARWANAHYVGPEAVRFMIGGPVNYANHDTNPSAQLRYIRGHPSALPIAVGRMVTDYGGDIARELVAQTSLWPAPVLIAVLVALGVVAIVFVDSEPLPGGRRTRTLGLLIAAAMTITVLVLAYIGIDALRAPRLDGLQGRYLFPVLCIVSLVAFPNRANHNVDTRRNVALLAPLVVGWAGLVLLLVDVGLVWHLYR